MELNERQEKLFEDSNFICKCEACENMWPVQYAQENPSDDILVKYNKMKKIIEKTMSNVRVAIETHFRIGGGITHGLRLVKISKDLKKTIKLVKYFDHNSPRNSTELGDAQMCLETLINTQQMMIIISR